MRSFLLELQISFSLHSWKLVVVAYSDRRHTATHTWNTPKQWFWGFCSSPLSVLIFNWLISSDHSNPKDHPFKHLNWAQLVICQKSNFKVKSPPGGLPPSLTTCANLGLAASGESKSTVCLIFVFNL